MTGEEKPFRLVVLGSITTRIGFLFISTVCLSNHKCQSDSFILRTANTSYKYDLAKMKKKVNFVTVDIIISILVITIATTKLLTFVKKFPGENS